MGLLLFGQLEYGPNSFGLLVLLLFGWLTDWVSLLVYLIGPTADCAPCLLTVVDQGGSPGCLQAYNPEMWVAYNPEMWVLPCKASPCCAPAIVESCFQG